jgi:hypothetical protein
MSSKADKVLGIAPARSAGAGPLPCLFVTTQSDASGNGQNHPPLKADINLSAYAKKAETLFINLDGLIRRVGIERVGFVTLTFAERVVEYKDASRRFNNIATSTLKPEGLEFVAVPERQVSGRFHFHLAAAFPYDIRSGFDFAACQRANAAKRDGDRAEFRRLQAIYCRSANRHLRQFWALLRSDKVRRHGFGRCETLPLLSNAAALARYVGAYVTSAGRSRLVGDKGMRSVRYSLSERRASCRWSWADGNGLRWRRGCQILTLILELPYEQYAEKFSKKWAWRLKEKISVLGEHYEEALRYAALVPEWADYRSRLLYLARVSSQLAGVEERLLPEIEFERDRDENETPF